MEARFAKIFFLLYFVVVLVVVGYTFTHDPYWIQIYQPDWLVARSTDVAGLMVSGLAVRQRGTGGF